MSKQVFEVTEASEGVKHSINAALVASVIDNGEAGSIVTLSFGGSLEVKESYRSVRGYVKKGLAVASEAVAPEAPAAEVVAD